MLLYFQRYDFVSGYANPLQKLGRGASNEIVTLKIWLMMTCPGHWYAVCLGNRITRSSRDAMTCANCFTSSFLSAHGVKDLVQRCMFVFGRPSQSRAHKHKSKRTATKSNGLAQLSIILGSKAASINQCLQVGLHLGDHLLDVALGKGHRNDTSPALDGGNKSHWLTKGWNES